MLGVVRAYVAADDTLSTIGLQNAEDNTDALTSTVAKIVLVAANTARTGDPDAALVDVLKGFGRNAPDGTMRQLVSYLETALTLADDSNLLGSLHCALAAVSRRTGRVYRAHRCGKTGFDVLDDLAARALFSACVEINQ